MELEYLRPLFAGDGPWASVYLDTTRAGEHADGGIDRRWRGLAERLTRAGADPATIAAIGEAIHRQPCRAGRHGLAIFARGGVVALIEPLPAPPAADLATWGPLPHAMPMVALRGEQIAYVRVAADPTGGAVEAVDAATGRAVAEVAAQNRKASVARYGNQPHAEGLDDVVVRLRRGQVESVLLVDDPHSTDRLFIGAGDPRLIATQPGTLRESGADPIEVRADAALLRAVVGTGAGLLLVDPAEIDLANGIGAILRPEDDRSAA